MWFDESKFRLPLFTRVFILSHQGESKNDFCTSYTGDTILDMTWWLELVRDRPNQTSANTEWKKSGWKAKLDIDQHFFVF